MQGKEMYLSIENYFALMKHYHKNILYLFISIRIKFNEFIIKILKFFKAVLYFFIESVRVIKKSFSNESCIHLCM